MGTGGVRSQAFVPDYTLRAITNVVYLRVTRSLYQAARSATLLERAQRDATLRVHDYESDLEQVFGGSCNREEIDLVMIDRLAIFLPCVSVNLFCVFYCP